MKIKTNVRAGLGGGWMSTNHNQSAALRVRSTVRAGVKQTMMGDPNHNQMFAISAAR